MNNSHIGSVFENIRVETESILTSCKLFRNFAKRCCAWHVYVCESGDSSRVQHHVEKYIEIDFIDS